MTNYLSNKFRWLSLIATWAVVCIHSRTDRWAVGVDDYASRIEAHVADLFYFAVPFFFVVSGYMFVHSYEKYGWGGLVRRKFRSLYLPMVIWGIIGMVFCLPIRMYSNHDIPTIFDICKLPLTMFRSESVHFWYIRALVVWFAVAPLAVFVASRTWLSGLVMIAALLTPGDSLMAQLHVPVAVVFFLLGVQLVRIENDRLSRWRGNIVGLFVCLLGLILAFLFKERVTEHYFSVLLEPLFMIGVLWFGYDVVNVKFHIGKFPDRLNVLFFVYCMHLILLCWCGGIMRVMFGNSSLSRLCGYFLLWLTFWIDLLIANAIRRKFPCIYEVLAGGR